MTAVILRVITYQQNWCLVHHYHEIEIKKLFTLLCYTTVLIITHKCASLTHEMDAMHTKFVISATLRHQF